MATLTTHIDQPVYLMEKLASFAAVGYKVYSWLCAAPTRFLLETMLTMQLLGLEQNAAVLCISLCAAFVTYSIDRIRGSNSAVDLATRGGSIWAPSRWSPGQLWRPWRCS